MKELLYEASWHYKEEVFTHLSAEPLEVIRKVGQLVTGTDSRGTRVCTNLAWLHSSPEQALLNELADLEKTAKDLQDSIKKYTESLENLQKEIARIKLLSPSTN